MKAPGLVVSDKESFENCILKIYFFGCLKKLLTQGRTHARTVDDGQWAVTKAHIEHFVLR